MKKIFISKTVHNTVSLYIAHDEITNLDSTLWSMIIVAMESWAVWKTNIGDSHTGWEFSKEFTPEMIQSAFKKVSGITAEII